MKTRIQNLSFLLTTFLCFSLFSINVSAQQTKKISLQGFLKDANGKAIADGQQEITFKLYTVTSGGSAEWTETQTIGVFGGVYSTHLGKTVSLENLNWGSATYYVGVTIQGTELTPRTELTFAPYSLGSPKAQEVVCSGAVGDVKYSILNPTQFTTVNGSCWVPMTGGSMSGSKLATILGSTNIPDAGGLFIRAQETAGGGDHDPDRTASSPIATFEDQTTKAHTHPLSGNGSTNSAGNHSHGISLNLSNGSAGDIKNLGGFYPSSNGSRNTSTPMIAASDRNEGTTHDFDIGNGGTHTHTLSGNTDNNNGAFSGSETRPKNMNLYIYIRIN